MCVSFTCESDEDEDDTDRIDDLESIVFDKVLDDLRLIVSTAPGRFGRAARALASCGDARLLEEIERAVSETNEYIDHSCCEYAAESFWLEMDWTAFETHLSDWMDANIKSDAELRLACLIDKRCDYAKGLDDVSGILDSIEARIAGGRRLPSGIDRESLIQAIADRPRTPAAKGARANKSRADAEGILALLADLGLDPLALEAALLHFEQATEKSG